ncbi:MAG: glutaredoxin family protein [Methermicoccaceae archaeon]
MVVKVYSMEVCPRCEKLKEFLKEEGIPFEDLSLEDPEILTDLRLEGIFVMATPLLQVDDNYYYSEELFSDEELREDVVLDHVRKMASVEVDGR